MTKELSEEELAAITVAFGRLDIDGDGRISRAELCAAMLERGYPLTDEAIDRELARADLNADGIITLREWLHMWRRAILGDQPGEDA